MIYDNVMGDDNDDVPGVRSLSHVNLFRSLFERPLKFSIEIKMKEWILSMITSIKGYQ